MHWRLAAVWFVYMTGMGLVFPFQALYFGENAALAGFQLGLVLSLRPLMGLVFQPLWGQLADRSGRRSRVLATVCFGNAIGFVWLANASGFVPVALAMALTAAFGTSIMPLGTSVSMAALGDRATQDFGKIRLSGTVSFLIAVSLFPIVLDAIQRSRGLEAVPGGPSEPGLEAIFIGAALASGLTGLVALWLPTGGSMALRAKRGDFRAVLQHAPYRRILIFSFLAFLFLTAPIQFFPMLVRERGGDLELVARLWIPMIALEIPFLFYQGQMLRRLGARGLVALGIAAEAVRWTGSAWVESDPVFYALQLLHGVSVGGLMMGLAIYVEQSVPERLRSSGQAGLGAVGASLAGFLSNLLAGAVAGAVGIHAIYWIGGIAAFVLLASLPLWMPRPDRPAEPGPNPPDSTKHMP